MEIELHILDWENYQPRKDLLSLTWFRMDSAILDGNFYFEMKHDGFTFFAWILTQAAKKNNPAVNFSYEFAADKTKLDKSNFDEYLNKLEKMKLIQVVHRSAQTCTELSPTLHNNTNITLQNKQNKTSLKKSESDSSKEDNSKIWQAYFNAFRSRYSVDPVRNAAANAQISNLRKRLGVDDAVAVAAFYLTHNDRFYLQKTHSVGLLLKDAETLRTQMLRGKAITSQKAFQGEKELSMAQNLNDSKQGGF